MHWSFRTYIALSTAVLVVAMADACTASDPTATYSDGSDAASTTDGSAVSPPPTGDADGASDGAAPVFVGVAMGEFSACAVDDKAATWCWGANTFGVLGRAESNTSAVGRVAGLPKALSVSVGENHACIVTLDHAVVCWGRNTHGELGHDPAGDTVFNADRYQATPTSVPGVTAQQVVTLYETTCALTVDGDVVCWGGNASGLLGTGFGGAESISAVSFSFAPVPIKGLPMNGVTAISGAAWPGYSICALTTEKNALCWGQNYYGSLGHFPSTHSDIDKQESPCNLCNPTPDVIRMPSSDGNLTKDGPVLTDIRTIAVGLSSCAIVGSERDLYCWGTNFCAQVAELLPDGGGPLFDNAAVKIATNAGDIRASETMCVIEYNHQVSCWGSDRYAVVGLDGGGTQCRDSAGHPTLGSFTMHVRNDLLVNGLALGHGSALAIDANGHLLAWGRNSFGELGHASGTLGDDADNNDRNATPHAVDGF